jgi:hypothetical protein
MAGTKDENVEMPCKATLQYSNSVSEWFQAPPPIAYRIHEGDLSWKPEGVPYYSAMYSECIWQVYSEGGKVYAKLYNREDKVNYVKNLTSGCVSIYAFFDADSSNLESFQDIIEVNNGWLIAYSDRRKSGDFSGLLVWVSKINCFEFEHISNDRIIKLLKFEDSVFALEGNWSTGKVLKIDRVKNHWEADRFARLSQLPLAATFNNDGNMIIVTNGGIIEIIDNEPKVIYKNQFWINLGVNSAAIDSNDNLYIGMRQGVAKLNLEGKEQVISWLVPNMKLLEEDKDRFHEYEKRWRGEIKGTN